MGCLSFCVFSGVFVPLVQQCRFKKFNTKRIKPGPHERWVLNEVTAPLTWEMLNRTKKRPAISCDRIHEKDKNEERNLYEEFLVRQARKVFEENYMVIVCQLLSMSQNELRSIKNTFINNGLHINIYTNYIVNKAIEDTKWINIKPLLVTQNMYIVSNDIKLAECVKLTRKMANVWILGGFVGDRLLSRDAITRYAELPHIDIVRGETLTVMGSLAQKTHSLLSSHQQQLSSSLDQYVKQGSGDSSTT